nr:hypothetical protein [Tanacetum cinerariifolium]
MTCRDSDSKEESDKVVLGATEGCNDEDQAGPDPVAQAEGQTETNVGTLDEGQTGSNPDEMSEVQAGPDPGITGDEEQSIPSPVVHAGLDREHMDLNVADVSPQPSTEQLDEGFTATAYSKVQENLKLAVEEHVLLEDPASSSGTLSSLQYLSRDISFGDQFFSDKHSDTDKNAETEVESMVNVLIQQALSSISLMKSPIIDLTSRPESPKVHQQFKATITDTTTTTTTTLQPPQAQQQSTAEAMRVKRIGELEHIMANLIQVNKDTEERLDKHGACLYTLEQLDIPQQVSIAVSEVVTDAIDWAMQAPLRNRFRDLLKADMKEILHQRMWETESYKTREDHKQLFEALEKSMNHDHSEELAQDLAEARKKKRVASHLKCHLGPHLISHTLLLHQQDHPNLRELLELSDHPKCHHHHHFYPPVKKVRPKALLHQALQRQLPQLNIKPRRRLMSDSGYIGSAHIPKVNLRQDWWKPLEEERPATPELAWSIPSSDAPVPPNNWASALASNYSPPPEDLLFTQTDDMATFIDWFCKRRGITELKPQDLEGPAFEIIKVFHPDVIHLQYQMEECHKLLTNSVDDPILRNNISKPLPPGGPPKDFQLGIESQQTQLNLTKPQWDATGFEYKHDYTIIDSPRAVIFWDKYGVQMMMRFNEIHKFSDGTLQQINEALDYRVKEFRINRMNPSLNTMFWTRMDVDRCKAFMFAIQRRLRTRRIFLNLGSFVGGCVRDGDYRLLKRTE